jgi:DNA mismatch repair protein MutL
MTIKILSPEVASQIAAGEVVERPASVVKELVENALDAGAHFIEIKILEAGKKSIEVADDGCGIPKEELSLAIERHATSKLNNASDLFQIRTLGFRGEALASIGSISRLILTSRSQESEVGGRLRVEAGKVKALDTVGVPIGTVVRVDDLFYNTPARRKFLKTETTERRHIDRLVTRYALAYPDVRFQLYQDERQILKTSGNGERREILVEMYGADAARQMLQVIYDDTQIGVQGFISPTSLTRSNRKEITFFVNGRPVQDAALIAALLKGYHTLLMVGRYPIAVLFVELSPDKVDVNVHPTKAEVRFEDPSRLFTSVQSAIRRALLAYNPVPELANQSYWTSLSGKRDEFDQIGSPWEKLRNEPFTGHQPSNLDTDNGNIQGSITSFSQRGLPVKGVPLLRAIGQVANTYLVAEGPDGLYLIDQHAAHERVLFERFISQTNKEIPSQSLLEPISIELSSDKSRLLSEQLPILTRLGFELEEFGPNTFILRAIPEMLSKTNPASALQVLVEDFEEDETPLQAQQEARLIARICKRAAVKAGQLLSQEEQHALLQDLEACQSPRTCPHGRPTMIHLSVDLLERQFGRKGAR